MMDWFGDVPAFIITLAADYCARCSDADFCALVEHELCHILGRRISTVSQRSPQEGLPSLRCADTTSRSSSEWSAATVPALPFKSW